MTRVRLSVDIAPDLKRRVKIAAASNDQSVREWIEQTLEDALERAEDRGWMESDLSRLGEYDAYDWGDEGPGEGHPVRYIPGVGIIIEPKSDVSERSRDG
jgi:predicted transcriptional regulator